jgi:hypothetical protein
VWLVSLSNSGCFDLRVWWVVFVFLIEHDFFPLQFLPRTVKKIVSEKSYIIKLYKIQWHVYKFGKFNVIFSTF